MATFGPQNKPSSGLGGTWGADAPFLRVNDIRQTAVTLLLQV